MAEEENQVTTQKNQVTIKDPKKVEVGRRLAMYNCRKREVQKSQLLDSSQYYGTVLAVGVIGSLGYYLYQAKKGEVNVMPPQQPCSKASKFEME